MREEGDAMTEAQMGIMSFGDGGRSHESRKRGVIEAEKGKKIDFPLEPSKCTSANPCENDNPRELTIRNQMCVVLSHWICGNLLQQQQEMNIPGAMGVFPSRPHKGIQLVSNSALQP